MEFPKAFHFVHLFSVLEFLVIVKVKPFMFNSGRRNRNFRSKIFLVFILDLAQNNVGGLSTELKLHSIRVHGLISKRCPRFLDFLCYYLSRRCAAVLLKVHVTVFRGGLKK